MTEIPISVRLDEALVARVDAIATALSARAAGATLTRSNVIRVVLERGVDALETELGITKKRPKK